MSCEQRVSFFGQQAITLFPKESPLVLKPLPSSCFNSNRTLQTSKNSIPQPLLNPPRPHAPLTPPPPLNSPLLFLSSTKVVFP
ncbi:unnamed protein product, partial [Vitis vinifera]